MRITVSSSDIAAPSGPVPPSPRPPAPSLTGWPGSEIMADPITARVLFSVWSGDPAVVVPSPPGAGKTRLVALLAAALAHRADLRVGIAAQTREQAVEIARRLGALTDRAALMWKAKAPAPDSGGTPVVSGQKVRWQGDVGAILIGTTARWLFSDPDRVGADVLIVDESWQCTYADLGALGAMAKQVVCVGDPGQIDPVVTGDVSRWEGSETAPDLPAPIALLAAHGDAVGMVRLAHTWRLGPDTTALIAPLFYPDLPFTSKRPPEHLTDSSGTVWPELAHRPITACGGPSDPALGTACAARVRELLVADLVTTTGRRPMTAADVAVVAAHVTQAAAIRALLSEHPDVLVGTANSLQGLERPAVVVLHPLAGYRTAEPFNLDAGRACVMLSRHRAHMSVVIDSASASVLAQGAPSSALEVQTGLLAALHSTPAV
ncbi:AAA family ATPase [Rhodococcus erythropolis]